MQPSEQGAGEPFRWCVYCGADCHEDDPQHAADCPSNTGVFVVRDEDCGPACVHCGRRAHGDGIRCTSCGTDLAVGDRYMHREVEPGDPGGLGVEAASINEVICVGCAAADAIEEASSDAR
jgi:hypothetical protein